MGDDFAIPWWRVATGWARKWSSQTDWWVRLSGGGLVASSAVLLSGVDSGRWRIALWVLGAVTFAGLVGEAVTRVRNRNNRREPW
jgi:hypothetical protein